ncbi:butyrate kinase [Verrucomicrobiota bacterium]
MSHKDKETKKAPSFIRVSDLVDIAGSMPPKTVVIPGGHREEDLRLVESARDHGIVEECLLIGNAKKIIKATEKMGIQVSRKNIFNTVGEEETAAKAIDLVREGRVDIILKGDISTPILNRAILKLRVKNTMGLVTMFDAAPLSNNRPMFITDPGVTTECTYGRMIDLIENAADVARTVACIKKPRIALLSANEKVLPSLRSSVVADELTKRKWKDMFVYGPLSFDLATDMDSVSTKGMPHNKAAKLVAGKADILICPNIDTANAVYKTIMAMVKYGQASMAGITMGVQVPYVILSRSDPIETRLDSIALCCIYSERAKKQKAKKAAVKKKNYNILTLNPGSTSTKIAVFRNDKCLHEAEIIQGSKRLSGTDTEEAVKERVAAVNNFLSEHRVRNIDAVVGRGGFLKRPKGKLSGGTYMVAKIKGSKVSLNKNIIDGVTVFAEMDHASNLGIPMAAEFAAKFKVPAYVVDPVIVDEFCSEAEFSGYASIRRKSTAHALSVKAAVRRFAEDNKRNVNDVNIVVGHLGGGITIAAIRNGKMVDNSIALLGEGPFTPQRTGTLPLKEIIDLCYDGGFSKKELITKLTRKSGLVSYLNECRIEKIEKRIARGDKKAAHVLNAMAYQISKEIGAMIIAVGQNLEAIVLTGGIMQSRVVPKAVRGRISSLAPVVIYRESLEMQAMAQGAWRVLSGTEKAKEYSLRR